MSRWSNRRRKFREILAAQHCVYPASVYDPISARIAENIGYEMGMYAGSLAALAVTSSGGTPTVSRGRRSVSPQTRTSSR